MVLKRTRPDSDVLIIDASKKFEKVGKNNKLRARDIREIVDILKAKKRGYEDDRCTDVEKNVSGRRKEHRGEKGMDQ